MTRAVSTPINAGNLNAVLLKGHSKVALSAAEIDRLCESDEVGRCRPPCRREPLDAVDPVNGAGYAARDHRIDDDGQIGISPGLKEMRGVTNRLDQCDRVGKTTREPIENDRPCGVVTHHSVSNTNDDNLRHVQP